jgi:hypothetical protein
VGLGGVGPERDNGFMSAPSVATEPAVSQRWLFGPIPDLLFGCGLLYVLLFVVFSVAGAEIRAHQAVYFLPLIGMFLSSPHYGATILRVYERRDDRRSYLLFSLYATAVVIAAFAYGVYNTFAASLLVTVYLTWSPWHYTGQNYGLAIMFVRRRGVEVTPGARRWIYSSFVLSFAMVFLAAHHASGSGAGLPIFYSGGTEIRFLPIGIPTLLTNLTVEVVVVAYVVTLIGSAVTLLKRARIRDLVPTFVLMLTQALWFSIPIFTRHFQLHTGLEPIDSEFRGHYILWIVLGHAVQYLWVTAYFARSSQGWRGYSNYFAKTLIAGTAVWALPVIIFAPDLIGRLPFDAGLALLVAAAVNVHHFILDGAIWKLRNSRIANVLIRRDASSSAATGSEDRERKWVRHFVWATASACLVISFFEFGSYHFVYNPAYARQDYEKANEVLERLAWFGYDRAHSRLALGTRLAERGEFDEALRLIERSIELYPTGEAYFAVGSILERDDQLQKARVAYEDALALIPDRAELLVRAGNLLLRLGEPQQAREYLERAVALRPDHDPSRRALDRAESGVTY